LPKDDPSKKLTTCAILCHITETQLSASAHEFAMVFLDGIAARHPRPRNYFA
jgi:hypothetical protein